MLSEEMVSVLPGWSDEYREYTLIFQEYLIFKAVDVNKYTESGKAVLVREFRSYCIEGGFPQVFLTEAIFVNYTY